MFLMYRLLLLPHPPTHTHTFIKSESILCFMMYRMLLFLATLFIIVDQVFIIGEVYSIVGEVLIVFGEVCIIGEVYSIVRKFVIVGLQKII